MWPKPTSSSSPTATAASAFSTLWRPGTCELDLAQLAARRRARGSARRAGCSSHVVGAHLGLGRGAVEQVALGDARQDARAPAGRRRTARVTP